MSVTLYSKGHNKDAYDHEFLGYGQEYEFLERVTFSSGADSAQRNCIRLAVVQYRNLQCA